MLFETHFDAYWISMLYEGDNQPCMISVQHVRSGVVMLEDISPNALVAGASLRDTIGLSHAISVLNHWCISPNSDLWDLNHSRPHNRLPVLARDDYYNGNPLIRPGSEFDLLSETGWTSYEEGMAYYLYQHRPTMTLFMGQDGTSVMADDPICEVNPVTYEQWLNLHASMKDLGCEPPVM